MALSNLIPLIFIAVLVFVLIKFVKGAIKVMLIVFAVLGIISLFSTYNIYNDVQEFGESWEQDQKLFMLIDEGSLMTAMVMVPKQEEQFQSFSGQEFEQIQYKFNKKEYSELLNDYYKIIVIDFKTFKDLENIPVGDKTLSMDFIKTLLISEESSRMLAKELTGIDAEIPGMDNQKVKVLMFASLFIQSMQERGPLFFLEEIKNENVYVYPESSMFKAIRLIPISSVISFVKTILSKSAEASREGVAVVGEVVKNIVASYN